MILMAQDIAMIEFQEEYLKMLKHKSHIQNIDEL